MGLFLLFSYLDSHVYTPRNECWVPRWFVDWQLQWWTFHRWSSVHNIERSLNLSNICTNAHCYCPIKFDTTNSTEKHRSEKGHEKNILCRLSCEPFLRLSQSLSHDSFRCAIGSQYNRRYIYGCCRWEIYWNCNYVLHLFFFQLNEIAFHCNTFHFGCDRFKQFKEYFFSPLATIYCTIYMGY